MLTWVLLTVLFTLLLWEIFASMVLSVIATVFIWRGIPAIVSWVCGFLPYTYHEAKVVNIVDESDEFWFHGPLHSRRNIRRGYAVTFEILKSGKKKRVFIPFEYGSPGFFEYGILCMQGVCYRHFSRKHTKRPDDWGA